MCYHNRIASVSGRTSDCCYVAVDHLNVDRDGYVPSDIGIGAGNYIDFVYCLDCGKIISTDFPIPEDVVKEALEHNDWLR